MTALRLTFRLMMIMLMMMLITNLFLLYMLIMSRLQGRQRSTSYYLLHDACLRQYSGKRNNLAPVCLLTVTHQRAACNEASVHFGPTIRRTDIFLY